MPSPLKASTTIMKRFALIALSLLLTHQLSLQAEETTSLNSEVVALPTPGTVTIDGLADDWDLSASVWSYNSPDIVETYSAWTSLMWDEKGLYYLARIADSDPMKNATEGVDFSRGWRGDAVQLRMVVDPDTADEHQMHLTLYHSTPENKSYMIVHHGGWRSNPPYDPTGPARPDLKEKLGSTMDSAGGEIVMKAWDDGRGYNIEAFMPWSYLRLTDEAFQAGDRLILGWETMWAKETAPGETPENKQVHRLADGVKDANANRIFMFRARRDWGSVVLSDKGDLDIASSQKALQASKLAKLSDLSTLGSIPIQYELPSAETEREVTIAIDNEAGERVRNLIGQYPRGGSATLTDWWDGLDDDGRPVEPGKYTAIVVDHEPFEIELRSTLYNAGTPPWANAKKNVIWGSDHGAPASVSTYKDQVYVAFSLPEAGMGLNAYQLDEGIEWCSFNSASDLVATEDYIYTFEFNFWQQKFLLSRVDSATGRLAPYQAEDGSQPLALELDLKLPYGLTTDLIGSVRKTSEAIIDFVNGSSIAFDGSSIWLLVPDNGLYQVDPDTGELQSKGSIPEGLLSLRSRAHQLYGLYADKTLWSLDSQLLPQTHLLDIAALTTPGRFGISQDQTKAAIADLGTNQVFVYDLSKAEPQPIIIGQPRSGKERLGGVFDRNSVMHPSGLDFDSKGRLWVAEGTMDTHRTSVWNPDGSFADEFWGASPYGATKAYNIPHDASRYIVMGTEFEVDYGIDPTSKKSEEKPLYQHPQLKGTQGTVYRYEGKDGRIHEFAASAPNSNASRTIFIYRRGESGEFVPAVALLPAITDPIQRERTPFSEWIPDSPDPVAWVDHNGDGQPQPDEFITEGFDFGPVYWSAGWVRPDMTILTTDLAIYRIKGVNEHGVPIYDFAHPEQATNTVATYDKQGSTGTPVIDDAGNITNGITYHTIDGRKGSYPNRFGRHDAPAAQRGLLIAPFRTNGVVEDVPGVGSVTMLQGDRGQWFLMSFDGLYLSSFFQDIKGRLTMDETFIDGESFGGHFWRVSDGDRKGQVMLQTGKSAYYIFELLGLDSLRRQEIPLTVTEEQINEGMELANMSKPEESEEAPLIIKHVKTLPQEAPSPELAKDVALMDGMPFTLVSESGNPDRWFKVSLMTDGQNLTALWQVADFSPWQNASDRFTHAFIGGDSVNLMFDTPDKGAIRLLAAPLDGEPSVVFWQKKAFHQENPQTYVVNNNPSAARHFEVVKRLPNAVVKARTAEDGYTVLMTVPLSELGLHGQHMVDEIKGLAGAIYSNSIGTNRSSRIYWHDKATTMVNDVPTESSVDAERFGTIQIQP